MHEGYGNAAHVLGVRRSRVCCDGYFTEHSEQPSVKGLVSPCVPRKREVWKPEEKGKEVSMEAWALPEE